MATKSGGATAKDQLPAYAVKEIIGRRSEQQDSAWAGRVRLANGETALLLVVADGMGGAAGGQIASTLAVEAFRAKFDATRDTVSVKARLNAAVDAANAALAEAIAANRALDGMGTTFIGAVVRGTNVTWLSVGDSLLLEASDGSITRLNEDHSLAAVLDAAAERGEISVAEAQASSQRNVLRSALTGGKIAMREVSSATLKPGAWLIAATDGVLTLPNAKIAAVAARSNKPQPLADELLAMIAENMPHDQDNVTLAVTRIRKSQGASSRVPLWAWAAIVIGVVAFFGAMALIASMLMRDDTDASGNNSDPVINPAAGATGAPRTETGSPRPPQEPEKQTPIPVGDWSPSGQRTIAAPPSGTAPTPKATPLPTATNRPIAPPQRQTLPSPTPSSGGAQQPDVTKIAPGAHEGAAIPPDPAPTNPDAPRRASVPDM